MGKKAVAIIGSENEGELRKKESVKREQKKLREHKGEKQPEPEAIVETPVTEEVKKVKIARIRSKPYQTAKSKVDVTKTYTISDAIKLLRDVTLTKFDGTVELHLVLKDLPAGRQEKEIELPHSTGKVRKIGVANDEFIKQLESGTVNLDLDSLYASPDQMGKLVKFAKVLGPKGLMPNPKNGTVVPDPEKSAKTAASKTSVILKTEKDAPLIHTTIGKLSMNSELLTQNLKAVLNAFAGQLTKAVLKSTMSPAIKLTI
ncbi:MAG: hypothetical protein AAB697_02515 [Patescibacteria group bacterium]